jgi:hypothetical protein
MTDETYFELERDAASDMGVSLFTGEPLEPKTEAEWVKKYVLEDEELMKMLSADEALDSLEECDRSWMCPCPRCNGK